MLANELVNGTLDYTNRPGKSNRCPDKINVQHSMRVDTHLLDHFAVN